MKAPIIKIGNWTLLGKNTIGLTLYPFIFLKRSYFIIHSKELDTTIRHETIHIRQQSELLIIGFYIWYTVEYIIRLLITLNPTTAYNTISFEREAYKNETNTQYLKQRTRWAFTKYLFKAKSNP